MLIVLKTATNNSLEVEVENPSDEVIVGVELKDDWITVGDDSYLTYLPETYIQHAKKFLNENPPDLKQAEGKVWGLMAHIVREFYLSIHIDIRSHKALRALAMYMFGFSNSAKSARLMTSCFYDAETCHKNFYSECYTKNELIEILDTMNDFMLNVTMISKDEIKKELESHIPVTTSTEPDLKGVVFSTVNYKEKLGGKDYVVKVLAR